MAQDRDLWAQALQQLKPEDRQCFEAYGGENLKAILDDVCETTNALRDAAIAKRWQYKRSKGHPIILRDVFEKLTRFAWKCASVLDVASNADPLHFGVPWAVVRFFLQAASNDIRAFGCLCEGLETTTAILARYSIIEKLHPVSLKEPSDQTTGLLMQSIVKVYMRVLKYLCEAQRFWARNSAERFVKNIFQDMEAISANLQTEIGIADTEATRVSDLARHEALMQTQIGASDKMIRLLAELQSPLERTAQDISQIQDKLDQEARREILHWLSTVAYEEHYTSESRRILGDTGQWLLQHPSFLSWQHGSTSDICWLSGIPGAGKSKLTAKVVQYFLTQSTSKGDCALPIGFFFASRKGSDKRQENPQEILLALLRQLCSRSSSLPLRGAVAQEYKTRRAMAEERGSQPQRLEPQDVVEHILNIANLEPLIIVIDALDEVDYDDRSILLDAVEDIVARAPNVVKVFVSSRRDGDVSDVLRNYVSIQVEDDLNKGDIDTFIQHEVEKSIRRRRLLRGNVTPALKHEIISTLSTRAGGMFRWVELSLNILSNPRKVCVEADVRFCLVTIPPDLAAQYRVIYNEIMDASPSTSSLARRIFSWLLASMRPLTTSEFVAAVALDETNVWDSSIDCETILDICRNLVREVPMPTAYKSDTASTMFQVTHLSVKEFLQKREEFQAVSIHTLATSRCLQEFDTEIAQAAHTDFRRYARYLFDHSGRSSLVKPNSGIGTRMKHFIWDETGRETDAFLQFKDLFESDCIDRYRARITGHSEQFSTMFPIHCEARLPPAVNLVCHYGLMSVLHQLDPTAQLPWKDDTRNPRCTNPLFEATNQSHKEITRFFLENHIYEDDKSGRTTCLRRAIVDGNRDIVDLLLIHGASPLHGLCENGLEDTDLFLAFRDPSCSHREKDATTVRLIFYMDAMQAVDPDRMSNMETSWQAEFLFLALGTNYEATASLLLNRAIELNYDTSLSARTLSLCWPTCRRRFGDPHASEGNADLSNPMTSLLQISVQRSTISLVKRMIQSIGMNSSTLDARDCTGRTAIHCLLDRTGDRTGDEHGEILQMLRDAGADLFAESDERVATVHVAAISSSRELMEFLVDNGHNASAIDVRGAGVLHYVALGEGSEQRVLSLLEYLMGQGLCLLARDEENNTPCHYASAKGNINFLGAVLKIATRVGPSIMEEVPDVIGNKDDVECSEGSSEAQHPAITTRRLPHRQQFGLFNQVNTHGQTLLHFVGSAVYTEDKWSRLDDEVISSVRDAVCLLINHTESLDRKDAQGRTPLIATCASRSRETGHIIVKELHNAGAAFDVADDCGQQALHFAARSGCQQVLELVAEYASSIDVRDNINETPLHHSVAQTHISNSWFLLNQGANIEARSLSGSIPLHYALRPDWLSYGTDLNFRDHAGQTPLHTHLRETHPRIFSDQEFWKRNRYKRMSYLLEAGSDPTIADNEGRTPMMLAEKYGGVIREMISEAVEK